MLLGAAGVVVALCALAGARPVEAAWTDSEYATASVTSTSMVAPAKNGCSVNLGLSVTYNWVNASTGAPRTGYVFEVYQAGVLKGSSSPAASATSVSTSGLLGTLLSGVTYDVRLSAANGLWRSPVATGTFAVTVLGVVTSCTW